MDAIIQGSRGASSFNDSARWLDLKNSFMCLPFFLSVRRDLPKVGPRGIFARVRWFRAPTTMDFKDGTAVSYIESEVRIKNKRGIEKRGGQGRSRHKEAEEKKPGGGRRRRGGRGGATLLSTNSLPDTPVATDPTPPWLNASERMGTSTVH